MEYITSGEVAPGIVIFRQIFAILTSKKPKNGHFWRFQEALRPDFGLILAPSDPKFALCGEYFDIKWYRYIIFFEIYTCKNIFDISLRKSLEL